MKHRLLTISLAAALSVSGIAAADGLPRIRVLATGGTIAGAQASATDYGYKSGAYDVNTLINAVPNLGKLANITGEQVANIGSQDMNDEIWLKLAKRVNESLASRGRRRGADHAWHGHARGNQLFPHARRQERQAGRDGRIHAARHRDQCGRPGQHLQRRGGRRGPAREREGHARPAERRVPLRAQRREDRYDQRADVRQPEPRAGGPGAHRHGGVVRADEQEDRGGHGVLGGRPRQAAARRHHLCPREHERRPDRSRRSAMARRASSWPASATAT